jgi:electron transfer flavoprotein beta subunit
MKILVCFKITPIWERVLESDWKHFSLQTDLRYAGKQINCFDESALEIALQLKFALQEQGQKSNCTALTAGEVPSVYAQMLLAAGFDNVIALNTGRIEFNPALTATALAKHSVQTKPDLILCGKVAGMADTGMVPLLLAEKLSLPILLEALNIKPCAEGIAVQVQEPEGIWERRVRPPLIVAVGNSPETLRAVSLRARATFRNHKADSAAVKITAPELAALEFSRPVSRRACKFIADDAVNPAALLLNEELRGSAFPNDPATHNFTIPPNTIAFNSSDIPWHSTEIAVSEMIANWQKPDYTLLPDTATGRRIASGFASATGSYLLTGAYFTEDGRVGKRVCASNLTWIHKPPLPAVLTMAQIPLASEPVTLAAAACLPYPWLISEQLVTTYRERDLDNPRLVIICGAGMGSREKCKQARNLAKKLKAGFGLTRMAVNFGWGSPAEIVGQSGCSLSAQVCFVLGASGSSAFLVGIENAGKIIAVNTDSSALIFKHADVGLTTDAPALVTELLQAADNL